jgi:hypothetical protein
MVFHFGREIGVVAAGAKPERGAAEETGQGSHPSHRQAMGRIDQLTADVNSHRLAMGARGALTSTARGS